MNKNFINVGTNNKQITLVRKHHYPMLRCVANDMNRWEIFPSLLISTSIS